MILERMSVGPMESNCYIIGCEETKEVAVIDPGDEEERIIDCIKQLEVKCSKIILTHGHVDHIGALEKVQQATGAKVYIHEDDAEMLKDPSKNLSQFMGFDIRYDGVDFLLKDTEKISVGNIDLEVIHTPGHTPGGICLKVGETLITGDTLFAGSVGRSDFPGGNHNTLIQSIKTKLLHFSEKTRVYPGHGPASSIEMEKRSNPFLN
ncbi:MAG: MBL fold metallo-hydrolase [Clostridiales bacterium]|nr:MBL fold metallo-hydrolase [Clostridiales bacterium]MCF8021106.1 MBL fold metallo-hydrolase [Clostridiales bacterium]